MGSKHQAELYKVSGGQKGKCRGTFAPMTAPSAIEAQIEKLLAKR
jgi:hypothetical protein